MYVYNADLAEVAKAYGPPFVSVYTIIAISMHHTFHGCTCDILRFINARNVLLTIKKINSAPLKDNK